MGHGKPYARRRERDDDDDDRGDASAAPERCGATTTTTTTTTMTTTKVGYALTTKKASRMLNDALLARCRCVRCAERWCFVVSARRARSARSVMGVRVVVYDGA
jgi:hypothetical protein